MNPPKATVSAGKRPKISQAQELRILRSIADATSSELDIDLILKEVVKIVNEMMRVDAVFIYLLDEQTKSLVLLASKTPHKKELGKIALKLGEGITGWVAQKGKPVAIKNNAYQDPRFKHFDILPEDRYEAFLSVPIIYKGKTIGVINVQYRRTHEFAKETVDLLNTIAKQVGGVIENAQLYRQTKQKAAQFDSLVKVSHSITSEHYLDEILNLIVVVTAEMLNSKICSIMLLDPKGEELTIRATQSLSQEYKQKPNIKVNSSLSGEAIKARKPVLVADVQKEEKYFYRDLAVKENLTSMLVIPMIVKNRAIGVINVYTNKPHDFSDEEVAILQMIANQAAVAVENTKLMEEALKSREALETRKIIERAKGVLMKMNSLTEDTAYRLINKKSMDSGKSMKEIAESILLMAEFQK